MQSLNTDAVSLEQVDVRRGRTLALQDVNLSVPRGAVTAVVGANGAGKSTLFGVIGGRLRPSAGRIRVNGPVAEVLQATSIDENLSMTVQDVVRQGRYPDRGLLRRFTERDHGIVEEALEAVDMSEHRRTPINALSGGQRQRVLVAQGIAQQSPIVLLDEPMTGVDVPTQRRLDRVIRDVADSGATVIFSTHSLENAAQSDVVVALACRCLCCAPTAEALRDPLVVGLFRPNLSGPAE